MPSTRLAVLASSLAVTLVGCLFIDNPNAVSTTGTSSTGAGGGEISDGGRDSGDDDGGPLAPSLCTKYGGYDTVAKVVGDLVGTIFADCRISIHFTSLKPDRQLHVVDCLTKQVAVLMHCPGIKYDIDSNGVECRDMKATHKGLSIREEDFNALLDDVVTTLTADGVAKEDIDALAPGLLFLKDDIVTNSAPHLSKPICDADAGDGG